MSATSTNVQDNIDNVTIPDKSPSDPREYKMMTLSNDIECILISDPDVEKAAMALCVEVGNMSDPDTLPGLAHFLEHMLFLGSAKYPIEGEYKQFLKDHGGRCNASTSTQQTCFQFDVGSDYLWEAMDRLSQFFISPLFTESATDRELNAVNSEHINNQLKDARRLYQFSRSLSIDSHPFHKFGSGNIQTLRENVDADIDVRSELLAFHRKYYSSSIMKLAIIGKEDISTMSQRVTDTFTKVPNLKIASPEFSPNAHNKDEFPALYKLVPIKEKRELRLNWIMDSCYMNTLEAPTRLLSYCLGDESKGSIYSYLKEAGLATSLTAGIELNMPEFTVFSCVIYLTPKGLSQWQDVVSIVYQYIHQMRKLSDKEWNAYFIERSKVKEMNFNFKGKEKSYGYVRKLARALHRTYPRSSFLKGISGLYMKYDYDLIRKYLDFLTVDNCYYLLIAKQYQDIADETEKWYGMQYKKDLIEDKVLQEWRQCLLKPKHINDKLYTPKANKYIADDFSIYCEEEKKKDADSDNAPVVIRQNAQSKIWFKMDETFHKPKLCVDIKVYSSLYNADGALSINLTDLVFMILNDELSDDTYALREASLKYTAAYNGFGAIVFKFNGYNQKLHLLVAKVLDKLQHLKITKQKYEMQKELLQRNIISMKKSQPYAHVKYIKSLFFVPKSVSIYDLEASLKDITFDKVLKQHEQIYEKGFVTALIYGNIDRNTVKSTYLDIIDKHLIEAIRNKYELKELQKDLQGALRVDEDEDNRSFCIPFKCPNDADKNSCVSCHYLYKLDDIKCKNVARLTLFSHLIKAPCFRTLRTEQQLGYTVRSGAMFQRGMWSFRVLVQSNNCEPNKLNENIETFVAQFRKHLEQIKDELFETNKASIITNLMEKSRTIKEQNGKYWKEIALFRYQFERNMNISQEIKQLTKEDVLKFYDGFIVKESKQRCKVTIECFGNQHDMNYNNKEDNEQKVNDESMVVWDISDVHKIREKYSYHPFPYNVVD